MGEFWEKRVEKEKKNKTNEKALRRKRLLSGEHVLSFYRGVHPCAGRVCLRAVCAIRAPCLGSPLLPVRALVHVQAPFLQLVVAVSSEAKKR